ncbi:hypothetical protein BB560_004876 [Smittium megazygosporum]|uniref:Asparagine synthetase domain-containing protein n=1 Tax=Smittium megazygosporum TaxID=133381 RepID=A0A2T9Z870_9FUNG|nr:hypothetical protein BB560_004876 [Smittium megazygosporum]
MCGIQVLVSRKDVTLDDKYNEIWNKASEFNSKRGPDCSGSFASTLEVAGVEYLLDFKAFVLSLRGQITEQPLYDPKSLDLFLWNGEVFDGLKVDFDKNDGSELFKAILQNNSDESSILSDDGKVAIISSTSFKDCESGFWDEVPSPFIYCLDFNELANKEIPLSNALKTFEWAYGSRMDKPEQLILPFREIQLEPEHSTIEETHFKSDVDINEYLKDSDSQQYVESLKNMMMDSLRRRILSSVNSEFAVLFSGGLDCMVLAALMDSIVPKDKPIELINVAFANPRILKSRTKQNKRGPGNIAPKVNEYDVPDRKTGLVGVSELRECFPERKWLWIEVNVPFEQAQAEKSHIIDLLGPNYTVMDLSIGMALWFAAKGEGEMFSSGNCNPVENYRSNSKVLILGMGADEQFGGYSRHRKAFEMGGIKQLSTEIKFDVERISKRNLGRDDRIIADHGREARFPYLDEQLVDFLSSVPIQRKMDMRLPKGLGDKLLLRMLAYSLNLKVASRQVKRAIQFGARTAKMESSKDRGADLIE